LGITQHTITPQTNTAGAKPLEARCSTVAYEPFDIDQLTISEAFEEKNNTLVAVIKFLKD